MKFARLTPIFAAVFALTLPVRADLADGIKAIVNDTVITYAQVEEFTAPAADTLRRQFASQPDIFQQKLTQALNDSLEQLVERQLILHSFETDGYKLPESVVDQLVQDRIRERFGDRVTLIKTLQAQGMTYEQFRKDVRNQYIEAALRNQNVQREIVISPYRVENFYLTHQNDFKVEDEIKLRMITLKKSSPDDTNTMHIAKEVLSEIKNGATFQEMATVYSQDAQQRQGGDHGWVQKYNSQGQLVLRKELADVAFALKPGETSGVIDLPEACYLVFVEQAHAARVKPLADCRDDIEKTLRTQEQSHLQKEWIEGLRKKTFIRYF